MEEIRQKQQVQTDDYDNDVNDVNDDDDDLVRSSWRRKCGTQSCAVSRPTTPDNISLSSSTITLRSIPPISSSPHCVSFRNLSASRSNFRWSYFGGKENSRGEE